MRFLSFLKRSPGAPPPARRVEPAQDPVSIEGLRVRTRRRLIGAAVLVGAAVLLLPAVFESAPRPVSDLVAIQMPPRETAATTIEMTGSRGSAATAAATAPALLPLPAPVAAPVLPTTTRSVAGASSGSAREAAPAASRPAMAAPRPPAAQVPAVTRPAKPAPVPAQREEKVARADKADKPARSGSDKAAEMAQNKAQNKAQDKAQDKAAAAKKPADARVWVQVGAYAEPGTVKTVRQRVDKLGMKTQEQAVQTASGQRTRVRLGPFASREEAERAVAKLRTNGLGASVVSP